jgi:hypothetical protein
MHASIGTTRRKGCHGPGWVESHQGLFQRLLHGAETPLALPTMKG